MKHHKSWFYKECSKLSYRTK